MKRQDAFDNMRKHKAARERRAADIRARIQQIEQRAEIARMERESFDRRLKQELDEIDRKSKETMERITYEAGMSMWGCDLTACLFNPKPLPIPAPPVYGGEPYKMMKIPREAT